MDARLTIEQRELADAAERLAARLGPGTVGDLDDVDREAKLDAALGQAGWRELRAGARGEPIASGVEVVLVAKALARHACDTPYIGPVLAHDLRRRAGMEDDGVARTIAVESDLSRAAMDLTGLAFDADGADVAVVLAGTLNGISFPYDQPLQTRQGGVDLTRSISTLSFDESYERESIGASDGISAQEMTSWTALAVTLTTADLVGAMEGTTALAVQYAKDRRQYGAPIGSYQAVQHLLAEATTLIEGANSALLHAAWAIDALPPDDALAAAAVAKAYASRAARTVCETSIQVHGGIGNTWECMAHVFLRRVLLSTELFGGEGAQLALLAQQRWGARLGLS